MKSKVASLILVTTVATGAQANLLVNGNLDKTYLQEIVSGFFLPKPASWTNVGSRSISGAYEDEMSSEPWAGPAPTPVTTDGKTGDDWGVFFKGFSGNATDGSATGHLYQDVDGTAGTEYMLTGWAGAEANFMADGAEFAIDFVNAAGGVISSSIIDLKPTLTTPNGQAFSYKKYSVSGVAPAGTSKVRARASMLGGMSNPAGGGQAYVVDDFTLVVVPEPSSVAILAAGLAFIARRRKSSK